MLVLTRKLEEEIRIGEQVIVRILAVKDGQVKIGIDAPKSIRVLRGEVYAAIQRQNEAATKAGMDETAQAAARLVQFHKGTTDAEAQEEEKP